LSRRQDAAINQMVEHSNGSQISRWPVCLPGALHEDRGPSPSDTDTVTAHYILDDCLLLSHSPNPQPSAAPNHTCLSLNTFSAPPTHNPVQK